MQKKRKGTPFSCIPHKLKNNQNHHSEGGTTAETLSNHIMTPRCALDDVNMRTKKMDDFLKKRAKKNRQ